MPGKRIRRTAALVLISVIMLTGCASEPAYPPRTQARQQLIQPQHPAASLAASLVGTPYRYGGSTPRGFDCSGLVYYTFRENGIRVPRTTRGQYHNATHVPRRELQPGDLVFFRTDRHDVSHVGIYAGNNRFIHAPSHGRRVSVTSMSDSYWGPRFVGGGRYF